MTEDDRAAHLGLMQTAFLSSDDDATLRGSMDLQLADAHRLGEFIDGELVGSACATVRELTVPEAVGVEALAVSWVAVAPDQRRRGVLSGLMRRQLSDAHEAGGPAVAALWASEAAIYQRFGYGCATTKVDYRVSAKATFRPEIDLGDDRVREVAPEDAVAIARPLYDAYAARRPGCWRRTDRDWRYRAYDPAGLRGGRTAQRWAVHPDGFATFRAKHNWTERGPDCTIAVDELIATTPAAHAALLRYLLDMDLSGWLTVSGATDDPMPVLLENSRTAIGTLTDALYIRLVDLDRALSQRRYRTPVDVVIEISDALCPWNEGRWRLSTDERGGATVSRTGDPADLATRATELGATYLGGTRLTTLADAGLVTEHTPGAVAALSAALLSERAPRTLDVF
jgi:predicted acetyltransferase